MRGKSALSVVETAEPQWEPEGPVHNAVTDAIALYPHESLSVSLASAIERSSSWRYALIKRSLDILLSSLLLVVCLPIGLLVALLIFVTSPGPVFYRQERTGRFGVPFRIIKFRSMYPQHKVEWLGIDFTLRHSKEGFTLLKTAADPRITPFGRLIRKLSLDELPQLLNVLWGDMSLVGPRPIVEAERRIYGKYLIYYDLFCPGITGLWQVSGRSDVGYHRRVLLDKEYASRWSCLLDFAILLRTIPAVITMRGAY